MGRKHRFARSVQVHKTKQAAAYGLERDGSAHRCWPGAGRGAGIAPLAEWREQLGIPALVANSPFRAETPRG